MDIYAAFATDETKENEGAWFDVPGGDARVRVARSNNPTYSKALVKAYEKYTKASKANGDAIEKQQEEEYIKLIARHILTDWTNVKFKGKALPYSVENAEKLLKIRDFRIFVQKCADDFDAYRVEIEEEVGNASEKS